MRRVQPDDRNTSDAEEPSAGNRVPVIVSDEIDHESHDAKLKIYFLPNLMTAGNLFCGFVALTKIVEADFANKAAYTQSLNEALIFILIACVFDILDGRVARMGGKESPFGQEFDSLADLISFGAAPAFLMHRFVLKDVTFPAPEAGWFIASVYMVCGAFRLARFNALAIVGDEKAASKDFIGFPIPAAAGLVVSITMFLLWCEKKEYTTENWRYALPIIMLFLSFMMVSNVRYPSFKSLNLKSRSPFAKMVGCVLCLGMLFFFRKWLLPIFLPAILTLFLVYGFIRPKISRTLRREIEEEFEEDGAMEN